MNSSSNVIMAATMIMVVSLIMVLTLLLVILAELYCSLLLNRRRRNRQHSFTLPTTIVTAATTNDNNTSQNPLQSKTHLSNFLHESDLEPVGDNFVYISNPIYSTSKPTTPFETPESSPSKLEIGDSDDDEIGDSTPKLSPMKDLPEKACSVSLKDAKSLESSASESNNSSSSSGSPYTSPSW